MNKYKIMALYAEGTLLDAEGRISIDDKLSLQTIQEEYGFRLVLLTEDPDEVLLDIARQLNMHEHNGYIISMGGSCITSARTRKVLACKDLSASLIRCIDEEYLDPDTNIIAFGEDVLYATHPSREDVLALAQEFDYPVHPLMLDMSIEEEGRGYSRVILSDLSPRTSQLLGRMITDRYAHYLNCSPIIDGTALQITPAGANYAGALQFILDKLDLTHEQLIFVGNRKSHIDLIQMAGLGVATADAPEAVKSCADYVTYSKMENGVTHMIEKHITNILEEIPITPQEVNQLLNGTLVSNLGIHCTHIAKGYVEATMPVDERTRQPMGVLHGGASLALAETIAGLGSVVLCKDGEMQVGMQVSGNHVASTPEGDTVRAQARIIHHGRSTHVWSVEIYSVKSNKLICTCRVLNSILNKR